MKQIRDTYKKTGRLHHAYGILGDKKKAEAEVLFFLEKDLKFPVSGNPDFWQGDFNVFKVADSRKIFEAHLNKPVRFEKKVFVITTNFITKDAQNSLLKIFEEPRADTTFFLVLPGVADLLPTLKSRLIIGQTTGEGQKNVYNAKGFLESRVGKRLSLVAQIIKDIKDEKIRKFEAVSFVKDLEQTIKTKQKLHRAGGGRDENLLAIEDMEKAISYLNDESPSIKIILEHLAITLPQD
jgi:hypothetical protein